MNQLRSRWALVVPAALAVAMFATQPLQAELLEKTKKVGGTTVHYKVVLPNGYDPAKAYPGILAARWRSADDEHGGQRPESQLPCGG